jgi:hypothetical protein
MKKILLWLVLIPLSLLVQTCSNDDAERATPGNIQFAFQVDGAAESGRTAEELVIPPGSNALISVKKHNGQIVYTRKPVEILAFGKGYITSPLAMAWGGYYVTDFLIADADNNIIFATPLAGSPLASLIDHPVPFYFAIQADRVTHTGVQTISTDFHMPQAFGYATFGAEVVTPDILLTAFAANDAGELKPAKAHAYVLHGTDTIFDAVLGAKVNTVHFEGIPTETYTLVLTHPGFARYQRTFVLADLKNELHGDPLAVVLNPALTMVARYGRNAELSFKTPDITLPKAVYVDWGDGEADTLVVEYQGHFGWYHNYETPGEHFVSVTGDLDIIHWLGYVYFLADGNSLHVQHLSELREIIVPEGLGHIDLSHNKKLQMVQVVNNAIRSIDVSDNHALTDLRFSENNNNFNAVSFRKMIDDIYTSVVAHPRAGHLYISRDGGGTQFLQPPSPSDLTKLKTLRDTYGWEIFPNPAY